MLNISLYFSKIGKYRHLKPLLPIDGANAKLINKVAKSFAVTVIIETLTLKLQLFEHTINNLKWHCVAIQLKSHCPKTYSRIDVMVRRLVESCPFH